MSTLPHCYFDNAVFRGLISKDNTTFDRLFDLIRSEIEDKYVIIFTWFLLLESVGLGKIKEYKDEKWERLPSNLSRFQIDLEEVPDKCFEEAKKHYLSHPRLKQLEFLKRIDEQLPYTNIKNPRAKNIIEDTIIRLRDKVATDYDESIEFISEDLAWSDICGYDYFSLGKYDSNRDNIRKLFVSLWRFLSRVNLNGCNFCSYCLIESMVKEISSLKEVYPSAEIKKKFEKQLNEMTLSKTHDLCDAEVIHFATFGYNTNVKDLVEPVPVIVYSLDRIEVLQKRIATQQLFQDSHYS